VPCWIWEIDWLLSNELIHLEVVVASSIERRKSYYHLICQNTECPPINRERMAFFIEDFRSKIFGSSTERKSLSIVI
jgi:hypothetical protein